MSGYSEPGAWIAIRDCGFGRVWTRVFDTYEDARAEALDWRSQGRDDGFLNSGDYFVARDGDPYSREMISDHTGEPHHA